MICDCVIVGCLWDCRKEGGTNCEGKNGARVSTVRSQWVGLGVSVDGVSVDGGSD